MLVKFLFFLVLSVLAFAKPQTDEETKEALKNLDVNAIENRIEFISNFHHSPISNVKEGDIITITLDPPTPENAAAVQGLVNSFSIAIGTGSGFVVNDQFFMESERLPIPTSSLTYKFQLPAQMENKEYCIVYTPYADSDPNNTDKPMIGGVPMESLYETWFPIQGSLEVGAGPESVPNTIANDFSVSQNLNNNAAGAPVDNVNAEVQNNAATTNDNVDNTNADPNAQTTTDRSAAQTNEKSGSSTISPTISAFIAILFACFFI